MSTRAQPGSSSEGIDYYQLPKALVTRIAKSALSPEAKLQKDTINTLINSTTVFINFLAATAHDIATSHSRKTIMAPDILKALEIIEFGDLVPSLQSELESYRVVVKTDKGKGTTSDVKGKGKEREPSADSSAPQANDILPDNNVHEADPEPQTLENIQEEEEGGVDEDVGMAEAEAQEEEEEEQQDEEEEEQQDEEEGEDVAEEVEDDAADEPVQIVDTMAIEEEELARDVRGLEESAPQNNEE